MSNALFEIDRRRNLFAERDLLEQEANLIWWRRYLTFRQSLRPSRQVENLSAYVEVLLIENQQRLQPYRKDKR